jgi:hypothetical protein
VRPQALLIMLLVIAVLIVGAIYISRFLLRRAVRQVVSTFRGLEATSPTAAATQEELGLIQRNPFERIGRLRDYRPYALRLLLEQNVVRQTEDGRLYLSERDLEKSAVKTFARIKEP